MKFFCHSFIALAAAATLVSACAGNKSSEVTTDAAEAEVKSDTATVFFTSEISPEALVRIYQAVGKPLSGKIAVKISTGESMQSHQLSPELISMLVDTVKGTLVECNTAYPGSRNTTEAHLKTIHEHGYDAIAAVDIMDSEGFIDIPVADTTHIKYDRVGSHLANYDGMINLAHFKGHAMGGFGGVLKNASIGVASSEGKAYIHTSGDFNTVDKAFVNEKGQDAFLESMAAAAQAVHNYMKGNVIYINVMNNMSVDCDCDAHAAAPLMKDMGILASTDPVALDKACLDLVFNHESTDGDDSEPLKERINKLHGTHTVDHAASIGLGTMNYRIVSLDK